MWNVNVGTLFPDLFPGPLGVSCIGKALGSLWHLNVRDLRNYALDKHKTVDDTPFGGGPGMVMKADVLDNWLSEVYNGGRIIYMSPRGKLFKQQHINSFLEKDLYILCGRYEGVDCRFLKHWNVEEVSIGDYVLCGGEIAAMTLVESCVRLIPNVLKNAESVAHDSLSNGLLEHDQYTKPYSWVPKNCEIEYNTPCVLKSGNHRRISEWKKSNSEKVTQEARSDLWIEYVRKKEKNADS
ncbi:MAG: tRNA (guanosine(37)-N1)-methyltransferase TrmD [Alphaproteobacteria bacterium]|nr:MAG: tRNA (guanosine(37)-N1)-methyltransferase TrmD [Alphaproteobacteria bacterium]